tara:strand:- start:340 stop:564 length:225 start_codon:yes stop_codon:yes gene_type:complete
MRLTQNTRLIVSKKTVDLQPDNDRSATGKIIFEFNDFKDKKRKFTLTPIGDDPLAYDNMTRASNGIIFSNQDNR